MAETIFPDEWLLQSLEGLLELVADYTEGDETGKAVLYRRAVENPPGAFDPVVVNSRAWRAAEVPAINGHGTARGAAGLYAALLAGRLVSPALLREATTAQCAGVDAVFGEHSAWGLGFSVDSDGFGMGGSGGSYAMAAARAMLKHSKLGPKDLAMEAMRIASEICIYTNANFTVEEL